MEAATLRIRIPASSDRGTSRRSRRRIFFRLILIGLAASVTSVFGENPDAVTDKMTDNELRAFRDMKVSELKQRVSQMRPQETSDGTIYPRFFFCTIYYTPKESGFTTERGFDSTPIGAPGLHGRKFPRDFLLAVKKEGFGRMNEPIDGQNYNRWMGDAETVSGGSGRASGHMLVGAVHRTATGRLGSIAPTNRNHRSVAEKSGLI